MSKTITNLTVLAVILAVIFGGAYLLGGKGIGGGSLEAHAKEVMDICTKDSYPPACYDEEIPKLMDQGLSMEDTFEVTRIIQNQTNGYFYCHVLGHNVAAKETAKDSSKWTEVVARCPIGMCSNGCIHGAAQERFRSDALTDDEIQGIVPELSQTCEPSAQRSFTGLEQASCYHALGHLTMYITGGDITYSTNVCDQIAKKGQADFTQLCYEGAYMQIFQPLEPEDITLVAHIPASTTNMAETLCRSYDGERRAACHRESWPLYRESLNQPQGLMSFCSLMPGEANEQRCYNAMFYVLTAQYAFDETKIIPLCEGLPTNRKAQCFANAASRFIETDYRLTDKAITLCKLATEHGVGDACYNELLFYSTFNFHEGSEAFNHLCAALPEPWSTRCKNGEGKNAPINVYVSDSEPARLP
jgi:hypothetical protein